MKKIVISELFIPPYDEGMKVTAFSLLKAINKQTECIGIGPLSECNIHENINRVYLSKLLFSFGLYKIIKKKRPDLLIYVPQASATLNSFIRFKILQWISSGSKLAMIALQHCDREYNAIEKNIIRFLRPKRVFVLSGVMAKQFKTIGVLPSILPIGVDMEKFVPVSNDRKKVLRNKYNIPSDRYLLLHVGHIKETRNLRLLTNFVSCVDIAVLIVGSTSTSQEAGLKESLRQSGIFIIDYFVPEIQEIYQLADCYIFPVIKKTAAIEFPLSVLEAMACNLPVITTPFGGLPEHFSPSVDFMYFNTSEELMQKFNEIKQVHPETRKKVEKFSWDHVAKILLQSCED